MKKRFYKILIILCLFIIVVFVCSVIQSKDAEQTEQNVIESKPLIIESTKWIPHGVFEGTIVINGEGIEDIGYEGVMYIEKDGKYIRISCTDAVRSRYGELF